MRSRATRPCSHGSPGCAAPRSVPPWRGRFVAAAGRGLEHVCRMARCHLGITPSVYGSGIRMQYAAMALGSSDQSNSGIALDCGIENMSHFPSSSAHITA
ncbi:MAG: helix-turn-helix domain-containing protein [Boseongicola sp. SB0677_bin_26]|nr:helix-turn-helix domain-containing protein [Boseongicola sp. SB0665_bin_10]MYG28387.1 helix-turn-helix domain-containing protein [Boseongicola sp. SB0677_bin_26]